jgi:hypothetical protein
VATDESRPASRTAPDNVSHDDPLRIPPRGTDRKHVAGYGLCGCEDPRRHEPGCLWGLDLRPRLVRIQTRPRALDAPRPGCCCICGQLLDREALRAGDDRCSACYRVIFTRRRSEVLGGGA